MGINIAVELHNASVSQTSVAMLRMACRKGISSFFEWINRGRDDSVGTVYVGRCYQLLDFAHIVIRPLQVRVATLACSVGTSPYAILFAPYWGLGSALERLLPNIRIL